MRYNQFSTTSVRNPLMVTKPTIAPVAETHSEESNSAPEKSYQVGQGPMGANVVAQLSSTHPLQAAEENYEKNAFQRDMQMLRKYEGLHAPLKLAMERQAFKHVGRLACLPSSNAHLDVLSGRDEMIDFSDFLGGSEFSEKLTNPHAVVAKQLNIL